MRGRTTARWALILVLSASPVACDHSTERVDQGDLFTGPGAFPGAPCRPPDDPGGACDVDLGGDPELDLRCVGGVCTLDCAEDASVCERALGWELTCAETLGGVCAPRCEAGCAEDESCFERDGVCLPLGFAPGGACRAAGDPAGRCEPTVFGVEGAAMRCEREVCVVDCAAGGDALCAEVNEALACADTAGAVCAERCLSGDACADPAMACFTPDEVCLPIGSFPGGPCRAETDPDGPCDGDLDGVEGADMRCERDVCVVGCAGEGDALCQSLSVDLVCAERAGDVCAERCLEDGSCSDPLMTCLGEEDACLPAGSFPGAPCRAATHPDGACDAELAGVLGADLACEEGRCLLPCADGDEAMCAEVDPDLHCSESVGGYCVGRCDATGSCRDPSFTCYADEGSCLPTGSFPGSPCRAGPSPCDHDLGGDAAVDMRCFEEVCVIDCQSGGDDLCFDLDERLGCMEDLGVCVRRCEPDARCSDPDETCIPEEDVCLPTGSFPGSPCRDDGAPEGPCDEDLFGFDVIDMTCTNDICLVSCADGGDGICAVVDPQLSCSSAAGDVCLLRCDGPDDDCGQEDLVCHPSELVCLPVGSFPGSACRPETDPAGSCDGDLSGVPEADMHCRDGTCVLGCEGGGDALCASILPDLACAETLDHLCAERCLAAPAGGSTGRCRDPSFECFATDEVCLPRGSFPGSPCRSSDDPAGACDGGVAGVTGADMVCRRGLCVIDCAAGGDALCQEVSSELVCAEEAGDLCAPACGAGGSCEDPTTACSGDVCLPIGSVPGGPCRAGGDPAGPCDDDVAEVAAADMVCRQGLCVIACDGGGDGRCAEVREDLRCSERAGLCAEACSPEGGCRDAAMACFEREGVCLPLGSFPGSACREGASPCDHDLGGVAERDMVCLEGVCALACGPGGDAGCRAVEADLTCVDPLGVCAPACLAGTCDDGASACFEAEDACLPLGTFPGSACRPPDDPAGRCDVDLFGVGAFDMVCEEEHCLVSCAGDLRGVCPLLDPSLACAPSAGVCVPRCELGRLCADGLACETRDEVCLPVGAFPGSPCRPSDAETGRCDLGVAGVAGADMRCVEGQCVIDCATGGDPLCAEVDPTLTCAEGAGGLCAERCLADGGCREPTFACFAREDVCLPAGTFPGGPCRPLDDPAGACDRDVGGVIGADMRCVEGQCAIDCALGGDALCAEVAPELACVTGAALCAERCGADGTCLDGDQICFEREGVCLPAGAFPGSPCRATDHPNGRCDPGVAGRDDIALTCLQERCLVPCQGESGAPCAELGDDIVCSAASGYCLERCAPDGSCAEDGWACFADDGTCLPLGTFPGSPCRAGAAPCDHDIGDDPDADLRCLEGRCVFDCTDGGDALCLELAVELTCIDPLGACVRRCDPDGTCQAPDEACFEAEGACLPAGGFPGSPCRAASDARGRCDTDLFDLAALDMVCVEDRCVLSCAGEPGVCSLADPSLGCSLAAGGYCLPRCSVAPGCADGFDCFDLEDVCLPTGSFPGGPCRDGSEPGPVCDQNVGGNTRADMTCVDGVCAIGCGTGGDALCASIEPSLTCAESAGRLCAERCLADGTCRDGTFSCFELDGVCLPTGSYPGGPCRPANDPAGACDAGVNGVSGADMRCLDDRCVIDCATGGDSMCGRVSPQLACADGLGDVCVERCETDGSCRDSAMACEPNERVCLPIGSVPGGPCRGPGDPAGQCDRGVAGVNGADMTCLEGRCVIGCGVGGDGVCQAVSPDLICAASAGFWCVEACLTGDTCRDPTMACFTEDGACLPIGSFPTSPCRDGASPCDHDVGGDPTLDLKCVEDVCVLACDAGGDAICAAIDPTLACLEERGVCVRRCVGELCADPAEACFVEEGLCLPIGSFPGSPCRPANDPEGACDRDLFGFEAVDMSCLSGRCVVACDGASEGVCPLLDPSLRCAVVAGGFCALRCEEGCPADFECLDQDGVCLPTGSFPGSQCRSSGLACDVLDVGPMRCTTVPGGGRLCLLDCESGGDSRCEDLDPTLVCADLTDPPACLPLGDFVGSPCRPEDDPAGRCAISPSGLACRQGQCTLGCEPDEDLLCDALAPGFVCSTATGGICAPGCAAGPCPEGRACYTPDDACLIACDGWDDPHCGDLDPALACDAEAGVCRLAGTFAGATCRPEGDGQGRCDPGLSCVGGACMLDCTLGGEALCALSPPSLGAPATRCVATPSGSICQVPCSDDTPCASFGGRCDLAQGACLPYQRVVLLHATGFLGDALGAAPVAAYTPASPDDDGTLGGAARLATLVQSLRAARDADDVPVVVLAHGNHVEGSVFGLLDGRVARDVLVELGFGAVALGERELDAGPGGLAVLLDEVVTGAGVTPWLATNLHAPGDVPAELADRWSPDGSEPVATHPLRPTVLINAGGIDIGVIGLIGERAARRVHAAPLELVTVADAARDAVADLRAQGAELTVALMQATARAEPVLDEVEDLLAAVPDLDVVIAYDGDAGLIGLRRVRGALEAQAHGRALGELELAIGRSGVAPESTRWIDHAVDDGVTGDPSWITREAAWVTEVDAALAAIGRSTSTVLTTTSFDIDLGLGDLVVDAVLEASEAVAATTGASHSAIVLARELGPGPRALTDGDGQPVATGISVADAWRALPFGRDLTGDAGGALAAPLVDLFVTTDDLRQVFELTATLAELYEPGLAMRVAGLVVDVRLGAPPYQRVAGIYLTDAGGRDATGADLLTGPDITSTAPADLHRLTVTRALARQLAASAGVSGGQLDPVLRAADGTPLDDLDLALVDADPDGQVFAPLVAVVALVDALEAMETDFGGVPPIYQVDSQRIRICDEPDPDACPAP